MGIPSGCPRQKFAVNISWITLSGLSSSILISSRTTCFSLAMSTWSNRGRSTRSDSTSNAIGKCSSSTLALKQVISLAVKASRRPAGSNHRLRDLLGQCVALGALKNHVLDKVRDPIVRRRFAARARAQPDPHRNRTHVRQLFRDDYCGMLGSSARSISRAGCPIG